MMEGVLAIIGVFFVPPAVIILVIWVILHERRKRNQLQADLCAKAIEKGQEMPANFFVRPRKNALNIGIICIAAGIGISLSIYVMATEPVKMQAASLGIIPFFIGLGYLIIHFIEKKRSGAEKGQ